MPLYLLSLNFLLADNGGRGDTRSCSRVRIPTRRSQMMNFLSPPCTVTLSACGAAPQCVADCRCRLVACGPQPIPRTLHHVSARLMLVVFINFNLSFSPYTALEQSTRRWQEQLLTSGLMCLFFLSFSCLMCAADIFYCRHQMRKYFIASPSPLSLGGLRYFFQADAHGAV